MEHCDLQSANVNGKTVAVGDCWPVTKKNNFIRNVLTQCSRKTLFNIISHNQNYLLNVCWACVNYIPWIEVYIFISSNLNHVDSGGDIELKSAVVEDASARGTNIEPLLTTLPALLPPSNTHQD